MTKSAQLHPRNPHHGRYDLTRLCSDYPPLQQHLTLSPVGEQTINFSDPQSVQALNAALLQHYYKVGYWQLPPGYLCPPIPGRADYIHYAADLLAGANGVPTGKQISLLDIGCGANLIYPIIANRSYGWRCVGTDIDPLALTAAQLIIDSNPKLSGQITLRRQADNNKILRGVIKATDTFALSVCNPPFYGSAAEAAAANQRKRTNLKLADNPQQRNFAGQQHELWCPGGELAFIRQMIMESTEFASQVGWFSSLVSQQSHLKMLVAATRDAGAAQIKQIKMQQGQKSSHLLAWRF